MGRELEIQRANLPRILERLEEAGFLARKRLGGKSHAAALTATGRDLHDRIAAVVEDFERSLIERMPEEHRKHVLPVFFKPCGDRERPLMGCAAASNTQAFASGLTAC